MKRRWPRSDSGMSQSIPRRDFIQGVLAASATQLGGALLCPPVHASASGLQSTYYPPALTGLRGSHPGAFETAHQLRDGNLAVSTTDTGETYDLVVVGGGISGLSAAHFYRTANGPRTRILILDNHDDVGGHAKRNEFTFPDGSIGLANGGTLMIDSPRPFSTVASNLMTTLGVQPEPLAKQCSDPEFYTRMGLQQGIHFDQQTFGADHLAVGMDTVTADKLYANAPLPEQARQDLIRMEAGNEDYFPALSSAEKKDRLSRMSYRDFLLNVVQVHASVVDLFQAMTHDEWGLGIDAVSALDAWGMGMEGFKGLKLQPGSIDRMGYTPAGYADTGGSAKFHFPDGNASIVRLLVRQLIPAAMPGHTTADLVTTRAHYALLDQPRSPVRIRLNSTVMNVRHNGEAASARDVTVSYVNQGKAWSVRARHCVLACWNMIIPHLCPELPAAQQEALHQMVKIPLVYSNVALANWQAFVKLGIHSVYAPGGYHSSLSLDPQTRIGRYRTPHDPDQPIVLHMIRTPCSPGLTADLQNRIGRAELLATPFATFEQHIRDQLGQILGPGGFEPARDILGITVNRWPHGYAPEYNSLFDGEPSSMNNRVITGRQRFGRIAIANSDAGAAAYTDSAIDQAYRAINELIG